VVTACIEPTQLTATLRLHCMKEPVLGPVASARCPRRVTPLTFCTSFDGLEKQVWLIKSEKPEGLNQARRGFRPC
jgi:hypothetical protein